MQEHHRAILEERLNYLLRSNTIIFAELDTGGKIIQCPNCHVPFKPHLGNYIADSFPCESCKANITFRNSTAKTARCPCCNMPRPVPNNLVMLVCGGCQGRVLHQRRDKAVKCFACKHITIPNVGRTYGVRPANQDPPQVYRVVPPQVNQDPPQADRVVPHQVNQDLPQVNRVVPPQVNPPQVYRVVPPQVNQDPPLQVNPIAGRTYGVRPANQDPQQVYRVVPSQVLNQDPPQADRVAPLQVNQDLPQVNRVVPPQVNQDPPQVYQLFIPNFNQLFPPQVNRVPQQVKLVPQQVNRVVPPRVYQRRNRRTTAETESTASSSITPRPEIFVVEYADDSVAEAVRIVTIKRDVEVEEDKTEEAGSKKIRL